MVPCQIRSRDLWASPVQVAEVNNLWSSLERARDEGRTGCCTFHDLLPPDADLPGLVPADRLAGVGVDDLQLGVAHHRAARAGLHVEGLLGERQTHRQHRSGLCHAIALRDTKKTNMDELISKLRLIRTNYAYLYFSNGTVCVLSNI